MRFEEGRGGEGCYNIMANGLREYLTGPKAE